MFGDLFDAGIIGCDVDDELVDVVVGSVHDLDVVDVEKDGGGQPAEALVAVDEGVIVDDRLQQCRSFGPQVGVCVATEGVCSWPGDGLTEL